MHAYNRTVHITGFYFTIEAARRAASFNLDLRDRGRSLFLRLAFSSDDAATLCSAAVAEHGELHGSPPWCWAGAMSRAGRNGDVVGVGNPPLGEAGGDFGPRVALRRSCLFVGVP